MSKADILIIGAGATGLMAAHVLSSAGKKVAVLEARNRCGGRIHTLHNQLFSKNAELGAEFIHGDLPVTLNLLKEADIEYQSAVEQMMRYRDGKFTEDSGFEDWDKVVDKLARLKKDISIQDFLDREFPTGEFDELRASVIGFVSGYDTADPARASSFALRDEWQGEDFEAQHRVKGGYGKMIKHLEDMSRRAGAKIYLNAVVKEVSWQPGNVRVATDDGALYEASQLLAAMPLGVLQANKNERGAVTFSPAIPGYSSALKQMGFGSILKILLEFSAPFWEDGETAKRVGANLKDMGFILSGEIIPTWWTQSPQQSPVLTGWLGGLPAAKQKDTPPEEILQLCLQSIANIFKLSRDELKNKLIAFEVANWTADPFTRGSYAYDTVDAAGARKILSEPVDNTIFFAGEYLYEGPAMGTVEAALTSGLNTAKKIISLA
ncbi:NAD(P)/FAD-dependent oxidoreductase [Mucilaginibacter sp. L3T2-6]|uniref:flavin monoamine oxidase family protein n=1 Tax=Mucilaginibacter sp. L3T2-6 TaxID=3062491 RepID=UPI0026744396|nr:NAD(P)/FAD-dependent oxidoreductase [Mucilaginibacter sp. L3T2-6]MDO3642542.1 NAD(P)/FAD-dependent oxidoreductase [Mucilaginibacter sp. L3T2-6]MDV6215062.1 NAD(P)/FAD-dependent oxidoreductase [Mucilaginibacter sp. L3T2-6]